jgi:hypothetical protein
VGFDRAGNEALPIAERRQVQGRFLLRKGLEAPRIFEVGARGVRALHARRGGESRGADRKREEEKAMTNS